MSPAEGRLPSAPGRDRVGFVNGYGRGRSELKNYPRFSISNDQFDDSLQPSNIREAVTKALVDVMWSLVSDIVTQAISYYLGLLATDNNIRQSEVRVSTDNEDARVLEPRNDVGVFKIRNDARVSDPRNDAMVSSLKNDRVFDPVVNGRISLQLLPKRVFEPTVAVLSTSMRHEVADSQRQTGLISSILEEGNGILQFDRVAVNPTPVADQGYRFPGNGRSILRR
ncbi:hypothetical protein NE237_003435 [Protea cynaroides]|uniref:Uncharacterized protein n=1 Tax=Protea cynaroides TaxID=273540 RepID=A0A9Q0KHD2_9MAGN|nr:hypothetical protein NE237_003435 [Protea cynaroides]